MGPKPQNPKNLNPENQKKENDQNPRVPRVLLGDNLPPRSGAQPKRRVSLGTHTPLPETHGCKVVTRTHQPDTNNPSQVAIINKKSVCNIIWGRGHGNCSCRFKHRNFMTILHRKIIRLACKGGVAVAMKATMAMLRC